MPYGECFHVQTRWVLTRVGVTGKRCRLQIGLEVVFNQSVFLRHVNGGGYWTIEGGRPVACGGLGWILIDI